MSKDLSNPIIEDSAVPELGFMEAVKHDYWICCLSREASLIARKEVLTGKAKFGIIGDGKEVPQVAMARAFQKGDFRSGYYRDQTFMMALGECTLEAFFAQLYADTENDPFSGGRQMNNHYATPLIDSDGNWLNHTETYNISSDISSTGGQMARAMGLAFASKKYKDLNFEDNSFSKGGNEVSFVTIGDASTSEGIFWETINAASVTKVPLVVCVWDDGYGISVPIDFQTTKKSISKALGGFQLDEDGDGMYIYTVKAWDYPALIETFEKATRRSRKNHIPALIHVQEVTQPQGHSTSGSHERYKSKERLEFEKDFDCIQRMRKWMVESGIASETELDQLEEKAKNEVKEVRKKAWDAYCAPSQLLFGEVIGICDALANNYNADHTVHALIQELKNLKSPLYSEIIKIVRKIYFETTGSQSDAKSSLKQWLDNRFKEADKRYHSELYSDSPFSALKVKEVPAIYTAESEVKNGYEVLNHFFDISLDKHKELIAFGEDVGQIGDVNQGFAGLQAKYGADRVFDTGIREWTIMGQAIGLAMRGFRPIAEIQYLDYLIYGLEPLSDDLATLRYRSNGIQKAPAIIRTRGHRLEGIWHSGSPIGMLLHSLRGMYIMVPRNMTQAAGFYNTMLQSDDPGLIIECLNGYRLKETQPDNLSEFTVPLGVPEILIPGNDLTLVSYGSSIRIAEEAIEMLNRVGISVELIDVQTLLPFDINHLIADSIAKTNRVVFLDEDVPGGATSYMMQQVLEVQNGYKLLDSQPITITAHAHRPPYGSDGDYFTKPNAEDIFEACYRLINESNPLQYPEL